jgi:hypothetical protein
LGDDDIADPTTLCDPIIGSIGTRVHYEALNQRVVGYLDKTIGDDISLQAISQCDLINLIFDGAGISIDK